MGEFTGPRFVAAGDAVLVLHDDGVIRRWSESGELEAFEVPLRYAPADKVRP